MFSPTIDVGASLSNADLCSVFGCSPQGGMRRSNRTDTLALISDHHDSIYDDRWIGSVLHYTGQGKIGDQTLTSQNRRLHDSRTTGVGVYLFEVFTPKPKAYLFRGRVELADEPYQEIQLDVDWNPRNVWMFPIRLADGSQVPPVVEDVIRKGVKKRTRHASKLSDKEVRKRAQHAATVSGSRQVVTTQRTRDPYVIEDTKRRAKGVCQLCGETAPFANKKGEPFLEVHHIEWLARDGEDSINNTVALCPNCHRRMHVLDREEDKASLKAQIL